MAHVVAEPCFDCKYTDCVVVCPVDCFYEGAQILYIHPEECIDCEACVPECPVEAIFHEDNLPDDWKEFIALNAEEAPKCPVINEKKPAMWPAATFNLRWRKSVLWPHSWRSTNHSTMARPRRIWPNAHAATVPVSESHTPAIVSTLFAAKKRRPSASVASRCRSAAGRGGDRTAISVHHHTDGPPCES